MLTKSFRHVGIVVSDLEKALDFYTGLGLRVGSRQVEKKPYIDDLLSGVFARVETVKLTLQNGTTVLELLRILPHNKSGAKALNDTGITHFAIEVQNVDEVYVALGPKCFLSQPQSSPDGKYRVVFGRDPEGNHIEFVSVVA